MSPGHIDSIDEQAHAIYDGAMPRRSVPDPSARRFGAIIRRLREERGWTLAAFGRKADMNPTYLGFLERGENVPSLTVILRLAKVLDVDAADVIRDTEQKSH